MATASRQTNKQRKAAKRPAGEVAAVKKVAGKKAAGKKVRVAANQLGSTGAGQPAARTAGVARKKAAAAGPPRGQRPATHAATDREIVTLLNAVDDSRLWPATKMAIELVLLTGARPSDVRLATWSEFDLGQATWTIPAGRLKATQAFTVHLSPQALALLQRARSHQAHTTGEPAPQDADVAVFKGAKGSAMEKTALARALLRLAKRTRADGGAKLAPQDLRRSFRALLLRLDVAPAVAESCLGLVAPTRQQAVPDVQRAPTTAPLDPAWVQAWDRVGTHIETIRSEGA